MLSFKFIWSYVDKASVVLSPPPSFAFTFSLAKIWGKGGGVGGGETGLTSWYPNSLVNVILPNGIIHFSQNDSTTDEDDDGDDDDDEEVVTILPEDKYRMGSLEKMISVMALLVEESRGER